MVKGDNSDGQIIADGKLTRFDHNGITFTGVITAYTAGILNFDGGIAAGAVINVMTDLGVFIVDEDFGGSLTAKSVSRFLNIKGSADTNSSISVTGNAKFIRFGETQSNSTTAVGGHLRTLIVANTHRGQIAARLGLGLAMFKDTDRGLLAAGLNIQSLSIRGRAFGSVFSAGTWVGQDGIYNNNDDLITGGSIGNATVNGQLVDSVIAAGVLPSLTIAAGIPLDKRAYTGNPDATSLGEFDSAEAGGMLVSRINRLFLRKEAINTNRANGELSAIVTADGLGRTRLATTQVPLAIRTYNDPFGAPTVVSTQFLPSGNVQIVFSEPVNTASLILSEDNDSNGSLLDPGDVLGTVTLRDQAGDVINGLTGTYSTITQISNGQEQGVLTISSPTPFGTEPSVQITGKANATAATFATDPTVFDRSGLRSALRDFNQDGTVAVGEDVNGTVPNGNFVTILAAPVGDTFSAALDITVPQDTEIRVATTQSGIDVYHFTTAVSLDYLSVQYESIGHARMALFLLDDQGNGDPSDDTFEAVTRWESADATIEDEFESFMAFEMPQAGDYYLAVASDSGANESYSLTFTRASTDQGLVTQLGGALPTDERIAYVSNQINDANNTLGANEPKQLVYVNFDGGVSTLVDGPIQFQAFDAADFDITLAGNESDIIDGNIGSGVTGIMDNLVTIFTTTAPTHPAGMLNVQLLGPDLTAFTTATEGLFFTTIDPIVSGLDPAVGFSTILVGDPDIDQSPSLLGKASQIDLANLDKSDEAFVVTPNFVGASSQALPTDRLNEYSTAFANVIAHELGHILGLNHQTTTLLVLDDADNNPGTSFDANSGQTGLMAFTFSNNNLVGSLRLLGTAPLHTSEFSLGDVDAADLALRWLT